MDKEDAGTEIASGDREEEIVEVLSKEKLREAKVDTITSSFHLTIAYDLRLTL